MGGCLRGAPVVVSTREEDHITLLRCLDSSWQHLVSYTSALTTSGNLTTLWFYSKYIPKLLGNQTHISRNLLGLYLLTHTIEKLINIWL